MDHPSTEAKHGGAGLADQAKRSIANAAGFRDAYPMPVSRAAYFRHYDAV